MSNTSLESITLSPVKSFFVHMLTRDIHLKDAILDLLDNCVDGIQRIETSSTLKKKKPYEGYSAKISFSGDEFVIEDNCGGIPWQCHSYAFRMGRPDTSLVDKGLKTVGVYGIGMKRAVFKIGEDCVISTHSKDKSYEIHVTPDWLKQDDNWDLMPNSLRERKGDCGTRIKISRILPGIAKEFRSKAFENEFCATVATHFAFIMDKGFQVYVNGTLVVPKSIKMLFSDDLKSGANIRPFIYESTINGVDVFLAVGFARPIPSGEETEENIRNFKDKYSSADAGWTVVCNDRTVLYCDKTALTGWGVSGVPQYHPQFIAISGIVIFSSTDPKLLPTTTTKRGIDASSDLYLNVRDKMIEGMKIFTQYTNQWKEKSLALKSKELFDKTSMLNIEEVRQSVKKVSMIATRGTYPGKQHKPELPLPVKSRTSERISFVRNIDEIQRVSRFLFQSARKSSAEVGEQCFERVLKEAE